MKNREDCLANKCGWLENKDSVHPIKMDLKNKLLVLKNIMPALANKCGWLEHKSGILKNKTPL
ncbi:hypothetical protein [Mesobacillus foraminis]|uniref:hypothetical protein n=1 Tax=Mesobacillus foraminis TaxID=279826 RepID=UPI000EF484D4|nr:hypothetical protein [Mesobacillus foraminis]